jgi:hypothetical protein
MSVYEGAAKQMNARGRKIVSGRSVERVIWGDVWL